MQSRSPAVKILLGSWTGLVLTFFYIPIVLLIAFSFNTSRFNIAWQGFTLDWYRRLWHDTELIDSLKNSLIIASFTTVISVILGTGGAWLCHRHRFRFRPLLNTLILVPMLIPEVIMGISLLIFFTMTSNYGNQSLERIGIHSDPLGLGYVTVIISHVTFCFPFVLVGVQARLSGLDPSLEEAAMDLGATPLQALMKVIIPYLMPAILSGALMAFTLSLDELIVTYFTTGPQSVTLPIRIFGMAKVGLNPMLNAISTVIIVTTVPLVIWAGLINHQDAASAGQA